ncbi:MAG TPA: molybdenum cofactor biosynthesis protein MoaE [Opitutaceae bacterium]|jgi:molybdopterin synthase catalytic subunit
MPFSLTDKTIEGAALAKGLHDDGVGAVVTFEGRVRDANQGRTVKALEYESYDALVEKEGEKILGEAGAKFAIQRAVCVHRTGKLSVGDVAVWVGVAAGHRDAAFAACRFVIDEIKTRVPLWKKEHYADGSSEWLNSVTGKP